MRHRGRYRQFLFLRLAFLGVVLIAAFAFHASGQTLIYMRVARWIVIGVLVIGAGAFTRRREQRRDIEPPRSD